MSFRCLGNRRGAYDGRMEKTQQTDEDFLHLRFGHFSGSGRDDLNRNDQHRRCMGTSQAAPLVCVTQAGIQRSLY